MMWLLLIFILAAAIPIGIVSFTIIATESAQPESLRVGHQPFRYFKKVIRCFKMNLASVILGIEALLLLLPTTLYYLFGMLIAVLGFFGANKGTVTPVFLAIAAFLLLHGYGLYSLWWLVVKHRKVAPHNVPRFVWGGIFIGSLLALLFIEPYVISGFTPRNPFISYVDNISTMLIFGGGPLLVALTLLVVMQPWRKRRGL